MTRRFCEPCLSRHGAAQECCLATHEAEDGSAICIWCLDGEKCPYDRKVIASQKRSNANQTMEERHMQQQGHEPGVQVTAAVPTTVTKKICRTPGCGRQLDRDNQSGFCNSHRPRSTKPASQAAGNGANGHASKPEKTAKAASHKNGHAAANRANGHASSSGKNGKLTPHPIPQKIGRDQLVEERINAVMLAWPAAEKRRVVEAWLAGAI